MLELGVISVPCLPAGFAQAAGGPVSSPAVSAGTVGTAASCSPAEPARLTALTALPRQQFKNREYICK